MGRWSPTVVAEAAPQVRSGLARAIGVGMDVYNNQQEGRRAQERIELERQQQQRLADEAIEASQYRKAQAIRQGKMDEVEGMKRSVEMIGSGWGTTPPDEDPERLAGNTGPGGAESSPYPKWYMQERERIRAESRARYPGSGTMQQRDPATGQTFYLPVRRQFEDSQMAKLDARLKAENDLALKTKVDREKFTFEEGIRHKNQSERIRLSAGLRASADDEDGDSVDKEYKATLSGMGQDIDDERSGISAASSLSTMADRNADMAGVQSANQLAQQRAAALAQRERARDEMRRGGVEGYRDRKVRNASGADAKAVTDEVGGQLAEILNDPGVPRAEKDRAAQQYQSMIDKMTNANRAKYKAKTPLGKAMNY